MIPFPRERGRLLRFYPRGAAAINHGLAGPRSHRERAYACLSRDRDRRTPPRRLRAACVLCCHQTCALHALALISHGAERLCPPIPAPPATIWQGTDLIRRIFRFPFPSTASKVPTLIVCSSGLCGHRACCLCLGPPTVEGSPTPKIKIGARTKAAAAAACAGTGFPGGAYSKTGACLRTRSSWLRSPRCSHGFGTYRHGSGSRFPTIKTAHWFAPKTSAHHPPKPIVIQPSSPFRQADQLPIQSNPPRL